MFYINKGWLLFRSSPSAGLNSCLTGKKAIDEAFSAWRGGGGVTQLFDFYLLYNGRRIKGSPPSLIRPLQTILNRVQVVHPLQMAQRCFS